MKIMGLSCKATEIRGVVCDQNGIILNTARLAVDMRKGALKYINKIKSLINILAQPYSDIDSVGVVSLGEVDVKSGLVIAAPDEMSGLVGTDLFAVVGSVIETKVFVGNDAYASLLGEHWIGSAKKYKSVAMLLLDHYINLALMINEEICGKGFDPVSDCLRLSVNDKEVADLRHYISAKALSEQMEKALGRNACREEYQKEYYNGNFRIREVLQVFSEYLTSAIGNIERIYDPEAIVIGGEFAEWYDIFSPLLKAEMERNHISLDVLKATLGPDAGSIGAACICKNAMEIKQKIKVGVL